MDQVDYVDKAEKELQDESTYRKLGKDVTTGFTMRVEKQVHNM